MYIEFEIISRDGEELEEREKAFEAIEKEKSDLGFAKTVVPKYTSKDKVYKQVIDLERVLDFYESESYLNSVLYPTTVVKLDYQEFDVNLKVAYSRFKELFELTRGVIPNFNDAITHE